MNINAPANASIASNPARPPQPVLASAPEDTAALASHPVESGRPNAERLRANVADLRDRRPREEDDPDVVPQPGLGSASAAVIQDISRFFALGSFSASRLQVQGTHLRENSRNRALADKLAVSLKPKPFEAIRCRHFTDIIHQTQALPLALRCSVLALIPAALCEHLNYSGDDMGAVLQQLLTESATGFEAKHRYVLMDKISAAFENPFFQRHFSTAGNRVIDRLQMERTFSNFIASLQELTNHQNGRPLALALALAGESACPTNEGANIDAQTICNETATCTVTPLVRGLYMVHDHEARSDLWTLLANRAATTSSDVRKTLLTKLINAIDCLQPESDRVAAFKEVLEAISALPSHLQPDPVGATISQLQSITDPRNNLQLFDRLTGITDAAPPEHRAPLLAMYANALATRPLGARAALFTKILVNLAQVPVHHKGQVLKALALEIGTHPQGTERTQAYDAVFAAIKELPKVAQVQAAELLFTTIDTLPMDNTRHVKFVAAINFIKSHPVQLRCPMLNQLQQNIWCQATYGADLHCLEEFLTAMQAQLPQERQRALSVLYDTGFDIYDDCIRFAALRMIFREVTKLPQSGQLCLILSAAYHARDIDSPYMSFLFNDLVQCAQALPPEAREGALEAVAQQLKRTAAGLAYLSEPGDQLPPLLDALLETSGVLPEAMQVALLAQIKESVAALPPALQADAAKAVSTKINSLPLRLIQQVLVLQAV